MATPRQVWMPMFERFMAELWIDSKETGRSKLKLYGAQRAFLEEITAGLDRGVRQFVCLKARQLGISTVSLAVDLFWLFLHDGLQGALVTDTEGNRDKFRHIINRFIASLPPQYRVPEGGHNRNFLKLKNGSVLDYLVAGTRKGGGLGRGRAYNFLHATEVSSYGDPEGMASLLASLAEDHPDRLFIFESTARGFNLFNDMWMAAKEDPESQRPFFIGWWKKDTYQIPRTDERFEKYMSEDGSDQERERIEQVRYNYGYQVTPEQIAWYRWKKATRLAAEGMMEQEFPWTEDEAFILTGVTFFPQRRIAAEIKRAQASVVFKGFRYHIGNDFLATEMEQVASAKEADLRVYEEADEEGIYTIGCDPAYGRTDWRDRSAIQVLRCYAEKAIQVAEYASSNPETFQLAWILCHLAGTYRNCIINLEITGPGSAVSTEVKRLRNNFDMGIWTKTDGDGKFHDVFARVRWYLYHRPDSMGAGYMWHTKTTGDQKPLTMNYCRDAFQLNQLVVNSILCLKEMQTVVQEGATIEAAGHQKDDRMFALALANRAYIEWVRGNLIATGLTFDKVRQIAENKKNAPQANLVSWAVEDWFKQCAARREDDRLAAAEYE